MESKRIDVKGMAMRWVEEGNGPPVVFIRGIPTSPALWRRVIPQVKEARCLAWEMVGYGASIAEGRERDLSVARQAGYLASWMKAISIEGAVLLSAVKKVDAIALDTYVTLP